MSLRDELADLTKNYREQKRVEEEEKKRIKDEIIERVCAVDAAWKLHFTQYLKDRARAGKDFGVVALYPDEKPSFDMMSFDELKTFSAEEIHHVTVRIMGQIRDEFGFHCQLSSGESFSVSWGDKTRDESKRRRTK